MRARARYSRRCVIATSDVATRVPRVLLVSAFPASCEWASLRPEQFLRTNNSVKRVSVLNNGGLGQRRRDHASKTRESVLRTPVFLGYYSITLRFDYDAVKTMLGR